MLSAIRAFDRNSFVLDWVSLIRRMPMPLLALPAVFMRGGTSRAVMFHRRDLPERTAWDPLFLAAMGSPDPHGRQLNGMGGGISSLSKICVLSPSEQANADIVARMILPVFVLKIRTTAVSPSARTRPSSTANGPTAEDMLPQLPR
jgi:PrpF protein